MKHRYKPSALSRASVVAATLLLFATSSMAQWQWMDAAGRKVYSDRPPPADIPVKNIIKRPAENTGAISIVPVTDATANRASEPALAVKPSASEQKASADKQKAEENKKQKEAEQAAAKKAAEEKNAKIKAENCQRAKAELAALKTGVRAATVNAKGEPVVLDDSGRAAEEKRLNSVVQSECATK